MKLSLSGAKTLAICGLAMAAAGCITGHPFVLSERPPPETRYPLVLAKIKIERPSPETTVIWSPGREPKLEPGRNIVVHAPIPEAVAIYSVKGAVTVEAQVAADPVHAAKAQGGNLVSGAPSVWVSEIERQFMSREFRVLSRQQYHALLREQGVGGDIKAASILGADYIVQVNALEYRPLTTLGPRATVTLDHFEANRYAEVQGPDPDPGTSTWKSHRASVAMHRIKNAHSPASCSVYFDAKVVEVSTGEVICSYRERRELVYGREGLVRFLFRPSGWCESDLIEVASRGGSGSTTEGPTQYEIGAAHPDDQQAEIMDEAVGVVCGEFLKALTGR